jgi:hypothetical protein
VTVDVVPETSLIQVTATAPSAGDAERAADTALNRARPSFDQLGAPYQVSVVKAAAGTAQRSGLTFGVLAGVVVAVALIAAAAAFLGVRALQQARFQAGLVEGRLGTDRPVAAVPTPAAVNGRAHERAAVGAEPQTNPGIRRVREAAEPLPPKPAQ